MSGETSQTPSQKRAAHALEKIRDMQNEKYGNYLSYVNAFPAHIMMSGLGQALAFENIGKDKGHKFLYRHLNAWLCNTDNKGWKHSPYKSKADTLIAITEGTENDYINAQAEAVEYLTWLKTFGAAYLAQEPEPSEEAQLTSEMGKS